MRSRLPDSPLPTVPRLAKPRWKRPLRPPARSTRRAGNRHAGWSRSRKNPRGLAFGPDGALYVAESGTLSSGTPALNNSGSITKVQNGIQTKIVTGLPALTDPTGAPQGPQDIAFSNNTGYVLTGLALSPPSDRPAAGSNLGSLLSFTGGSATKIADLSNYEQVNNPLGDQNESNPFHVVVGPNGLLVTDAGANDLLNIAPDGTITTVATFPATAGVDAVPTGVAVGSDGKIYVGELTGFPFTPGSASIYQVGNATPFATGLTNITDLAFGLDGTLYALQFADNGILSGGTGSIERINADGSHSLIFGGLVAPTGLEIGSDGAFYVTDHSAEAGTGEVLRIAPTPEPATWAMMMAGFGLAGGVLRGRRRKTALHSI